ncbi:VRR-NUC domain containing protein [uncultured Caudovirales phage]|uniref:VRR-NUC domain containing protein n=1 Tax=uncultured Caudovirales phage TaxID=2100421 RepID=A0A6J7VPB1_9CAUD|nr:VRR-NUC domain containing protein [uncultured Caudovirales phage]
MLERDVEAHLVKRVKQLRGEVRKVKWLGRVGAPDRCVMLPGRLIWVELKKPGEVPRKNQLREHDRMRRMGQRVLVIDNINDVELVFA